MRLLGVVASLAQKILDGFKSHMLHEKNMFDMGLRCIWVHVSMAWMRWRVRPPQAPQRLHSEPSIVCLQADEKIVTRGSSSFGRALPLQGRGAGFKSPELHSFSTMC